MTNFAVLHYLSLLWAVVAGFLTQTPKKATDWVDALSRSSDSRPVPLFPRPAMIITLGNRPKEEVVDSVKAAGFIPQSLGRYKFYKGPATDEAIGVAIRAGCDTKCFSVQNTSNVAGILALSVINRILHATYCTMSVLDTSKTDIIDTTTDIKYPEDKPYAINESLDAVKNSGIFFPYFDGLLLPDKPFVINFITTHFSRIFGNSGGYAAKGLEAFHEGWSSLFNTATGRAISHAFFTLDLAMKAGCRVRPVYINNEYAGSVLEGDRLAFLSMGRTVVRSSVDELKSDISSMFAHENALTKIATILSGLAKDDKSAPSVVLPEHISGPRALHYLIRDRVIPTEIHNMLQQEVLRLKFRADYWSLTDDGQVSTCISALLKNRSLPVEAPFAYKTEALFTKDIALGNLVVFGLKAPSIIGYGNNIVVAIRPRCYEEVTKPGPLPGIPIFFKPFQEAHEDWKKVRSDGVIFFQSKGLDKMKRVRISAVGRFIEFKTEAANAVMSSLVSEVGRKRKRDVEADPEGRDRDILEENRRKKRRVAGEGMLSLAPIPGITAGEGEALTVEEDEGMGVDDDLFD